MADEVYTFIFVPDARARGRQYRAPARLVRRALRVAGVLALALTAALVHYVWLLHRRSELDDLRAANAALAIRAERYEADIAALSERVATLGRTVTKLGVMSGVEEALPSGGGLGGVPAGGAVPPSEEAGVALRSLSRDVSDLRERSARIEDFYADQSVLLSHTPSIWPVRGYLSSGFGNRVDPFTGRTDFHGGIDISAPRGTPIAAPADGVVVVVGKRGAYGRAVVVDHGFGIVTRYGHLDGYAVRAGQRVRRGDVLGYVGSTGRSNAPHVHYEVWVRDKNQNPIHFILDEYRSFG